MHSSSGRLALYGVILAVATMAVVWLAFPAQSKLQPSRVHDVRAAQSVLADGGPPLTGVRNGIHYAAGTTDDQGIYLYLPVLGHVTDITDPHKSLKLMWLILFGLTLATA